jgi:hypothetical protein
MSRDDLSWILLLIVLLVASYLLGQRILGPDAAEPTTAPATEQSTFRLWFWEERGLDIAVQVGLLFVGTLGIAALLPRTGKGDR